MTCKDCIHYNICLDNGDDAAKQNAPNAEKECDDFKNKSEYVKVNHGKWKPTKIPSYFGGVIYECSLCGAKDGDHTQILGRYCWRCGAKMIEQ